MTQTMVVRPAGPEDLGWILKLNRVHEEALSPLDADGLSKLVSQALLVRVVEPQAAFVICLDQDADYDSPNFRWFRERYPRFAYVDRIAVDADVGLRGAGSALYDTVFAEAGQLGFPVVCAEVNTDPPNPVSLAFHAKRGFVTAGEAHLGERGKTVRYLARQLN